MTIMIQRIFRSVAPSILIILASSPLAAAEGALLEKTVDVPRDKGVALDLIHDKVTLMWVETHNAPTGSDVDEAKKRDPKDKTPMLIRFHYKNEGYVKQKVNIRVFLLDASDGVVADGGRSGSLDAQQKDDTFSFPVFVKTTDWPTAAKMKIIATFK
jgi:hypothetical protein